MHKVGNNIFLCICYNILKQKQMSYLEYLLSIDDNVNSYGIEVYNKQVVYFCRFLIPQCYNTFAEICMNTPDLIDTNDILASISYFGAYISK